MKIPTNNRVNNYYISNIWGVVIIFILIIAFQSCRKPPVDEKICDCTPIPPFSYDGPSNGYQYFIKGPLFSRVCFNPNDDNEIIVHAVNPLSGSGPLYKYNLVTQVKHEIYNGVIKFDPEWGVTDWIIFTMGGGASDGDIWKIKSNGDSLTQLTFTGDNFAPQWNLEGEKFIFQNFGLAKSVVMTLDGEYLDTLDNARSSPICAWNNMLIAGAKLGDVLVDNIELDSRSSIHSYYSDINVYSGCETSTDLHSCVWENDNIFYSTDLGIFKVNMDGTNHQVIKESCSANKYINSSINQSKTKLLWIRVEKTLVNELQVNIENFIVTMNLDGTEEQIIEIP